ncbi:endonuclease/exonuclease/phosphatase family protein [Enterococcus thailandicus]|uniref:endonuclease/exonuclease/phosphatase family protein n=1 Tax=Enterococcus TaxID=1350 RepID=UPI00244D8BC8|nr:endonuclease/exonuclease/phosphatase family protein [Enterococcus thailandicus]MDK4351570.1 endonuclease/exonuclease/phosphatase family protein [Enterococcus thailandicus]MDT2733678.1 endonuclease/exonuclease/phosphatase family protein [Enterococcus thailandicus]MDT2845139.1 endonuclease/exonuclease/phosphatase family protein [Enterococcus thailandicus]GMC00904.1 hydrolase [Enterococcus thailandicus]
MKKLLKILLSIFAILALIIAGYVGYVYLSYHREADNQDLTIQSSSSAKDLQTAQDYQILTYNIGYAAYPPDYSFFMDGGTESRAFSKQNVKHNLQEIQGVIQEHQPDFAFFQEVDKKATRSYNIDEVATLSQNFSDYSSVYGQNYNSAYLFYPITQPIGKSQSGLVTFSKGTIAESTRYSLPIETGFNKFFDLDRAFTVSKIPVANGRFLSLYNLHLSAYTKDPAIQKAQIKKLAAQIKKDQAEKNYIIVGGDYNHTLLPDSEKIFGETKEDLSWTHAFPEELLPKGMHIVRKDLAEKAVPSVRNLNEAYQPDKTFVTLIDGFLVSDNLSIKDIQVIDTKFAYSDHNPVQMTFSLQ